MVNLYLAGQKTYTPLSIFAINQNQSNTIQGVHAPTHGVLCITQVC